MVAGHRDHLCACAGEREQRLDQDPLRVGAWRRGVVQVTGDQYGVDLMLLGNAGDLGQDGLLLVEAAAALKSLADVPVGGVQELHNDPPGVGCYSCSKWCSTSAVHSVETSVAGGSVRGRGVGLRGGRG